MGEYEDMVGLGRCLEAAAEDGALAGEAALRRWAGGESVRWGLAYPGLLVWAWRGCRLLDMVAPGRAWAWDAADGLDERACRLLSALLDGTTATASVAGVLVAERDAGGTSLAYALVCDGPASAGGENAWRAVEPVFRCAVAVTKEAVLRHRTAGEALQAALRTPG